MSTQKLFFVFPHPDDESFVSGGTIAKYCRDEQVEVYLYTLTRGEASRNASYLGITAEEIGKRRAAEVKNAAQIYGITKHFQGDYPDDGLRDIDLRILERDITQKIREINPIILLTYDVQGISVHPDHLVVNHVVKRCFLEERERDRQR